MGLEEVRSFVEVVVQYNYNTSHSMHEHLKAYATYQSKKRMIILSPNTVIQPLAVVVEPLHTPITLSTMLSFFRNPTTTNNTLVFKVVSFVELFALPALD